MSELIWQKAADCVGCEVEGALVLLDIESGTYFALNGPATDVYQSLDEPKTESSLVEALVRKYKVSPDECAKSVRRLLEDFSSKGLAKPVAGAGGAVSRG